MTTKRQFNQIVLCAADTVARLRRSDVGRVIDEAQEHGTRDSFAQWLRRQRPDLGDTINEVLADEWSE